MAGERADAGRQRLGGRPPAPALDLIGASVSVSGIGVGATARAGFVGSFGGSGLPPVSAVTGQNSLLRIDPAVVTSTSGGAPPFTGVTAVTTEIPALSVIGNANLFLSYDSGAGAVQFTAIGFPSDPVSLPGVDGRLWIDLNLMLVEAGVFGGFSGFPEYFLPPGLTLAIQVVDLRAGVVELSNPAVVTSRR